jgi:hypothetical protein
VKLGTQEGLTAYSRLVCLSVHLFLESQDTIQ